MTTPTKILSVLSLIAATSTAQAAPPATDVIPAKGGSIRITPIFHGSLQIEYRGKVIHVDPFSAGDYSKAKKADVILITHTHADHLDLKAIESVRKRNAFTAMVMPAVAAKEVAGRIRVRGANPILSISNGAARTVSGIQVLAVPMYNLQRGPKPGQKFHPKGQFNGYVLSMGGKRIYIAGDTEATPEMKNLKNIDVAFLPMNLPYTMTPLEAASGARAFKPKIVYPYHYRYPFTKANNNPQQFVAALKGTGVQVRLRNWYITPAKR